MSLHLLLNALESGDDLSPALDAVSVQQPLSSRWQAARLCAAALRGLGARSGAWQRLLASAAAVAEKSDVGTAAAAVAAAAEPRVSFLQLVSLQASPLALLAPVAARSWRRALPCSLQVAAAAGAPAPAAWLVAQLLCSDDEAAAGARAQEMATAAGAAAAAWVAGSGAGAAAAFATAAAVCLGAMPAPPVAATRALFAASVAEASRAALPALHLCRAWLLQPRAPTEPLLPAATSVLAAIALAADPNALLPEGS